MKNKNLKETFYRFLRAQSEGEVSDALKCLNGMEVQWKPYGKTKGNYSSFENQQTKAEPALVEKIMNSIDHSLIRQCLLKGIDPSSAEAPKTMNEATLQLYTDKEYKEEQVLIIVDGGRETPNIMIIDNGEGQEPDNFEDTLLSLQTGNKNNIKFVQGKFNMGSTGAVVFCGKEKYQLIASRKHSKLRPKETEIGFTLVRKHIRTKEEFENTKNTWYEYLTIDDCIPRFEENEVILSSDQSNRYVFKEGTIVKLYNYQLKKKSQAFQSLKEEVNGLLFYPAFPIYVHESRKCFEVVKTRDGIMNIAYGNGNLLEQFDEKEAFEYKSIGNLIEGSIFGSAKVDIFVFKENQKERAKSIRDNKSVVFLMNGQVQYHKNVSYISSELGLKLIKEHMIVIVDCTNLKKEFHDEGFFMANRETIKDTENTRNFINTLTEFLKENKKLIEINKARASQKASSTGTKELFERILGKNKQDDFLKSMFREEQSGLNKTNKAEGGNITKNNSMIRSIFPSIVKIKGQNDGSDKIRTIQLGNKTRINLEINAEDNYFCRTDSPGEIRVKVYKTRHKGKINIHNDVTNWFNITKTNLENGEMQVSLSQQGDNIKVDDFFEVCIQVKDENQSFNKLLLVKVEAPTELGRKKNNKKERLSLPPVIQVFKNSEIINNLERTEEEKSTYKTWEDIEWDEQKGYEKIVEIIPGAEEGEIASAIYINMSSGVLQRILIEEGTTGASIESAQEQFLTNIYMQSFLIAAAISNMQRKIKDDENSSIKQIEMENFVAGIIQEIAYASVKMQINNVKAASV